MFKAKLMKAIVYSTKKIEKETLCDVNADHHLLTWQMAPLNSETVRFAADHEVVIVCTSDEVNGSIIGKLAELGVKYILTRTAETDHIDLNTAAKYHIHVQNVPGYSPHAVAEHAVAISLALNRHLIEANRNCRQYDFSPNGLTGFNFHGKTIGILGVGGIGERTGKIFHGFGCQVLGFDVDHRSWAPEIKRVEIAELFQRSDLISLHVPLNEATAYMINKESIGQMKDGVMLINTARGGLVNTKDVLDALHTGKLGYYGADVYEYERGIFFEDHGADQMRDHLLSSLIRHPNVLVTPHQGFLTIEALREIADQTIQALYKWEKELYLLEER